MKPTDSNADQRAAQARAKEGPPSAQRLRDVAAHVLLGDLVEIPVELLTREERQQVWALLIHAAMRLEEELPPGVIL